MDMGEERKRVKALMEEQMMERAKKTQELMATRGRNKREVLPFKFESEEEAKAYDNLVPKRAKAAY